MSVVVRRAAADDLDPVRFVGLATWPATYGAIKGARYVTRGLDEYWSAEAIAGSIDRGDIDVAESDAGVVGMVEVASVGDDLVMWKLYVVPAVQHTGIGPRLIASAVARAEARGCALFTEYEPENVAAGEFYARQGFEPSDPRWPDAGGTWMRWARVSGSASAQS